MSFFKKLFAGNLRRKTHFEEIKISILGPSQVGKTTLIRFLETDKPQLEASLSTLGVDFRTKPVIIGNWSFQLIDVGGQKKYQDAFWEFVIRQANGLVYIIDAIVRPESDETLYEQHRSQFVEMTKLLDDETIIMILLNKQDLEDQNPISVAEFSSYYPLENLKGKTFAFHATSAKFGEGIDDAFSWFVECLNNLKKN